MAKQPKSFDFCTVDEKGRVSDRGLHADILGDDLADHEGEPEEAEPEPPEEGDLDVSDLDDIEAMLDEREGGKPKAE